MATQAKVTSIDALEEFRSRLIVFLNKAHAAVDQVNDDIRRTRTWIQHEQRTHWENEVPPPGLRRATRPSRSCSARG